MDDEDDTREPTRERKVLIFFGAKRKPFGSLLVPLGAPGTPLRASCAQRRPWVCFLIGVTWTTKRTRERERGKERENGERSAPMQH